MYHQSMQDWNKKESEKSSTRIRDYNLNPNVCQECSGPILHTDGPLRVTLIKKFCSRSCAAKYNNRGRERVTKVHVVTKRKILSKLRGSISHPSIRSHARTIAKPEGKSCEECGYSKFVEVCHVRAVKDFPSTATLEEINAPENLKLLCPNCHWEHDHRK